MSTYIDSNFRRREKENCLRLVIWFLANFSEMRLEKMENDSDPISVMELEARSLQKRFFEKNCFFGLFENLQLLNIHFIRGNWFWQVGNEISRKIYRTNGGEMAELFGGYLRD